MKKSGGMYEGVKIPVKYLDIVIVSGIITLGVIFITVIIK